MERESVIAGTADGDGGTGAGGAGTGGGGALGGGSGIGGADTGGGGTVRCRALTPNVAAGSEPNGITIDPAGTHAYVANLNEATVSVIDGATNTVTHTIEVGEAPQAVVVDPATHTVYVGNNLGNNVVNHALIAEALRKIPGIAVLHAWHLIPEHNPTTDGAPDVDVFRRLTRDLYIPVGDTGFWQGAFRDPSEPDFAAVVEAIKGENALTIEPN